MEDYQINIQAEFTENSTSLAYSTYKFSYALYPIFVEYLEDGIVKKSDVIISSDKKYDHEQIQKFEQHLFEIISEKIHPGICSDSWPAQFKSRHCVADLFINISLL